MTAACRKVPVVTTTLDLPLQRREQACQVAADLALHNNVMLVIVGQTARDELVLCADGFGCCTGRPGVISVVPDVEAISMWGGAPRGCMRMERADGRTAYVFAGGAR